MMPRDRRIALLPAALRIRAAIERGLTFGGVQATRLLTAARGYGDPEWALVSRWAGVPTACADTRELVIRLLRERASEVRA